MKKLLKGCFLALAAMVFGLSACSEPTEEVLPEVCFAKDNASKVDIAIDAKSFDIVVKRMGVDKGAKVRIAVTADSLAKAWFELPTFVQFPNKVFSAVYTVKVKEGAVLEYDKYAKISLAIAGEYAADPAVYTFEVGVPTRWSDWEKVDEGTYYPTVYWSGEQPGLEVYYRECENEGNDSVAQYRIEGIQNTMNLTVEYNRLTGDCQVLPQYAATNYKFGNVTVSDIPHSPLAGVQGTYEEFPCTYDAEKGLFTLNLAYVVSTQWGGGVDESFGCGVETFQFNGLIERDYSFSMQFRGHYIDANGVDNAVIAVSKGADVAKYLMTVVGADERTSDVVSGMLAGTVPCDTLTSGGFYACPMTASGNYKAVAIACTSEGTVIDTYAAEFEFWVAADSNPWQSIGYARYTDGVIAPLFELPVSTYYVKVLESKGRPGLFRVMDPYAPVCSLYPLASSYQEGCYIDIDATDPEGVWIEGVYGTGLYFEKYGHMSITSFAWYKADEVGATKEEVKEVGFCGVYADGVITFPVDGLVVVDGTGEASYANINGEFALDMSNLLQTLPEEGGKEDAPAARAQMNFKGESIGKVARFKKIDNSFLAPIGY